MPGITTIGLVEVREDASTIQVPLHTVASGRDIEHVFTILLNDSSATRNNDYTVRGGHSTLAVTHTPLAQVVPVEVEILDHPQLEDTEYFTMSVFRSGSNTQTLFECQYVQVVIEDDDTADTTLRIADGATADFMDFVNREVRVTEGNTIRLQMSVPAYSGDCLVPYPINPGVTATGDTCVIDQSNFTTDGGTGSGLRVPPCNDSVEMLVPTTATASDQGTRTVHFHVMPDADPRFLLEGGRRTVRYTVHIDDSEATSEQVEEEPPADTTAPRLESATVNGYILTLAYDETLDNTRTLENDLFAVNVNGAPRRVVGSGIGGAEVTLLLSPGAETGDTVTVAYTPPSGQSAFRIQDAAGNAAASFIGQDTANNTPTPERLGVPTGLTVTRHASGQLNAAWEAPSSGLAPTGYTLEWKQSSHLWTDTSQVSTASVTDTSHVITGLTDGTEYTVRVAATRNGTSGQPSGEVSATPQETAPPTLSTPTVDGATLTLTFNEALDASQTPGSSAFTVTVDGNNRSVDTARISGSTVSLTLATAAFGGEAVAVSYTAPSGQAEPKLQDTAGNEASSFSGQEAVNSTAEAERLTATVTAVPESHDGSTVFTFELRFSENLLGLSYKTLRDHAFTVTGGQVTMAKRLAPPSNVGWEIHVTPGGNGTVTVVLPVATDCTVQGAVCTADRRPLSERVEVIVPGPG